MLNKLPDFYRIVNLDPSDALITQRREAISTFLEQFSRPELRYGCADIAAFGVGPTPSQPQVEAAKSMIAAIQVSQPSFVNDIGANAVDLRVFAGVALGEYLETQGDGATAALVISALATRPLPQERYLSGFVSALLDVARQASEGKGQEERERPTLESVALQGTDLASLSKGTSSALTSFIEGVNKNLRADREELEILWYVFGDYSATLDAPLRSLDVPQRIFASASELAELVILPPGKGSTQFLHKTIKEDRQLTLRHLIEPCTPPLFESVARRRTASATVLTHHPALLPLTWLSCRRIDSNLAAGWETEFEQKTHISVSDERTAWNWAAQVFNECVAARLLAALAEQTEE